MKRHNGAALVVVLSLLTVSLMVGLTGMQSSQIDERLAGNYKAQSEAQMGAERAASDGWDDILAGDVENDDWVHVSDLGVSGLEELTWKDVESGTVGQCQAPISCYYRYVKSNGADYIVAVGAVDNVAVVSELVFVEVILGSAGGLLQGVDAALTCAGSKCRFFAENKPTEIDGRNYRAEVSTTGASDKSEYLFDPSDECPSGVPIEECRGDVASYVVPDGIVDLGKATVTGSRIFNREGYDSLEGRISETWEDEGGADQRIREEINTLVALGKEGDERITYWGSESSGTFTMPSSGIVVVDGADLIADVKGNFKFTGLIVVRDGDFNFKHDGKGSGTVSVVGAIIAQDAVVDMQNGNPALLYSSEALCMVKAIATGPGCDGQVGSGGGGLSGGPSIERWF